MLLMLVLLLLLLLLPLLLRLFNYRSIMVWHLVARAGYIRLSFSQLWKHLQRHHASLAVRIAMISFQFEACGEKCLECQYFIQF
jgi:hypothetical protein